MREIIPYRKDLKKLAQKLRKQITFGETRLWSSLKNKQIAGYDFHRQKPLLSFIVDFYCNELKLAIEIDGSSHDEFKYDYDKNRQLVIEKFGVNFLRFTEYDVSNRLNDVLATIENFISKTHP